MTARVGSVHTIQLDGSTRRIRPRARVGPALIARGVTPAWLTLTIPLAFPHSNRWLTACHSDGGTTGWAVAGFQYVGWFGAGRGGKEAMALRGQTWRLRGQTW